MLPKNTFPREKHAKSPQEQSTNPSKRGTSKDHHTNSILIPSIKHPTSFAVNYKNDLYIERDGRLQYCVPTKC